MSAQRAARTAVSDRQEEPFWQRNFGALAALALALLLPACTQAPLSRSVAPDPADPRGPAAPVTYQSTVGGYTGRRPVEPRPWGEQNPRVAPADKP
jgi:hypothetical protein